MGWWQLINTLQQKNQELSQEICILKELLNKEAKMLKKVSEERDSHITALCVMTKEINNQSQFDTKKQTKAQDLTS